MSNQILSNPSQSNYQEDFSDYYFDDGMPSSPLNMNEIANEYLLFDQTKYKNESIKKRSAYTKSKLHLSKQAQNFKNCYYLVFTNKKKKFPKRFIKKIHELIQRPLRLSPIKRDVIRFIDKYFEKNVNESYKIIQYLLIHKDEILNLIPDLKAYLD